MQSFRIRVRFVFVTFLLLVGAVAVFGQDGVSTAGEARTRAMGNLGIIPQARDVTVEDFVNYPRHEIARPKAGDAVGLDVRWGSDKVLAGGEAVLQVGLSTALVHDRSELRPLNLSIVIDKSGSMADDNKLVHVKSALLHLVSKLRSTDDLSIVAFDSEANVLLPSQPVGDPQHIENIVRELRPGSATNLNAGLMLGYQEALKNFRPLATNRVILLTDGIANRGVTDPYQIAQGSVTYNQRGIDLCTIGVGSDVNKDLLSTLAKSGRGLFHFVADSQDIETVFVREFQSLISPVATDPTLEIDYGPGLSLEMVYGYEPVIESHSVKIKLDNMNTGMTEVVLLRFKADLDSDSDSSRLGVHVRLQYHDLDKGESAQATESADIALAEGGRGNMLEDDSVAKNYSIANIAQSIKYMAADCEIRRYRDAENALNRAIGETNQRYPSGDDPDIKRTLSIAMKYQAVLRKQNQDDDSRDAGDDHADVGPSGANLVPNGDFSRGNKGFTSGLNYTEPDYNCLWDVGYTIAPTWNKPLLHQLFPSLDYAAPKRPSGNEQVLYANADGPEPVILWSAVVHCKRNSHYRISFQTISLNRQLERVPDYEIQCDGQRSRLQKAGYQTYQEIVMDWNSKSSTTATLSITRMPIPGQGGLVGISNIQMVEVHGTRMLD